MCDVERGLGCGERNRHLLQLDGVYAGALPISSKLFVDEITKAIRSQNDEIEVNWYRHEGKLTALVRFGGLRARPTHVLQQMEVGQGRLVVAGRSVPDLPPPVLNASQAP